MEMRVTFAALQEGDIIVSAEAFGTIVVKRELKEPPHDVALLDREGDFWCYTDAYGSGTGWVTSGGAAESFEYVVATYGPVKFYKEWKEE